MMPEALLWRKFSGGQRGKCVVQQAQCHLEIAESEGGLPAAGGGDPAEVAGASGQAGLPMKICQVKFFLVSDMSPVPLCWWVPQEAG